MRTIVGGSINTEDDGNPIIVGGGGSKRCKCVMQNGSTSHPVASCDQCFDFCRTLGGPGLVSTWCIGN